MTFIFNKFRTTSEGEYVMAVCMTFILALMTEYLQYLRYYLQSSNYSQINEALASDNESDVYKVSCIERFKIMFVYFANLMCSFMLMLVIMSFNTGIFISAVFGLTLGYYVFGFVRKRGFAKIYMPE